MSREKQKTYKYLTGISLVKELPLNIDELISRLEEVRDSNNYGLPIKVEYDYEEDLRFELEVGVETDEVFMMRLENEAEYEDKARARRKILNGEDIPF